MQLARQIGFRKRSYSRARLSFRDKSPRHELSALKANSGVTGNPEVTPKWSSVRLGDQPARIGAPLPGTYVCNIEHRNCRPCGAMCHAVR